MTRLHVGSGTRSRRLRPSLVVGFSLAIAVLGAFPYHLLYVFPLAAALTFTAANRVLRLVTIAVSLLVVTLEVSRLLGLT